MKKLLLITVLLSIFVSCKNETEKLKTITVNYPETEKIDTVNTYFGETVADPYRWLEDDRSKETEDWVKSQNQTTFGYLENIPYREELKERLIRMEDKLDKLR